MRFSFVPRGLDHAAPLPLPARCRAPAGAAATSPRCATASPATASCVPPPHACIREGASDGGEMGVMHALFQPQRETNLRIRLDEYLRFGLRAGLFYAT